MPTTAGVDSAERETGFTGSPSQGADITTQLYTTTIVTCSTLVSYCLKVCDHMILTIIMPSHREQQSLEQFLTMATAAFKQVSYS